MAVFDNKLKTFSFQKRGNIQVEVGDSKQPDFKPRVKLSAWDNECNVSFGLPEVSGEVSEVNGKISWQRSDGLKAVFYDLDDPQVGEDGGFEFEVHLPSKPASNVIELTLNVPKDLEFYYQPPLTKEEIAEGHIRPENVVGSYAVYHASQSGDYSRLGGKNYKTGKAFHIYRPDAMDAKGDRVWCNLKIEPEKQLATITIPQDWLDEAIFPVVIDPTFGYTSIGGSEAVTGTTTWRPIGAKFTFPSTSEKLLAMYSHARKYQNDFELAHAIYGVSGSAVGAKLAEDSGNAFVSSTTGDWYETSFSYTCAANTSYFLMFWGSSPHRYRYDTATTGDGCSGPTNATFETWPTSSFSVNNRVVSIYAVYGSISQTVNIDTSRGVMDSASFNADTKRRIAESASFGADTLREIIDEIEVGMNADTLRSIIDDVAIAADTRRRVYEAEISTILVDTKREVVTRYYADKSPLAIHFFPVGLRISPYTLEPGKYKKGTANLTPNSNQLVNRLWVKGGKTTSDPYSQPITVGTEPIPLLYSPRAPVTVIIGGVEKSLGIQNITEEGTCDFLLNVAEKLLVPDLCTSGSGTITYKYEYPIKILLEEPTSQAQYGVFEDILNVNTDDKMLALELGYQHLFKYSQPVISGSIEPFAGIYRPGDLVKTTIPELNIDQYLEVKEVLYDSVPGKSHVNIRLQLESPERDLSNVLKDLSKRIFQLEKAALRDEEGPVEFYISREESVFWMEENERVPAIEFHAVVRWAESMERVPSINLQETVYWSEHFEQVFSEDVAAESTEWVEDVDVEIYSLLPSETLYPDEDLYPM